MGNELLTVLKCALFQNGLKIHPKCTHSWNKLARRTFPWNVHRIFSEQDVPFVSEADGGPQLLHVICKRYPPIVYGKYSCPFSWAAPARGLTRYPIWASSWIRSILLAPPQWHPWSTKKGSTQMFTRLVRNFSSCETGSFQTHTNVLVRIRIKGLVFLRDDFFKTMEDKSNQ